MSKTAVVLSFSVVGVLALILQGVGFFSPAWMVISMDMDSEELGGVFGEVFGDSGISIQMGLWITRICYKTEWIHQCVSEAAVTDQVDFGNRWTLQKLAIAATICALVGICCIFGFVRFTDKRGLWSAGIAATGWIFSAVLIFVAVGIHAHHYSTYAVGLMELKTPWAIIVYGVGGVFAAVVGAMIVIYHVCRDRRELPGVWRQFESGKPI